MPALRRLALAAFALAALAFPASATTLFTEDFENGAGLADGNWATVGTATIVAAGNASVNAAGFTTKTAGANLYSNFINVNGSQDYWITLDFKTSGAGGWVRIEGYNNGGALKETILLFGDSLSGATTILNHGGAAYYRYSVKYTTNSATRKFKLELAASSSNSMPVGSVDFDNILVADTPPTTTVRRVTWREVVN